MAGARSRLVADVRASLAAARGQARTASAVAESRRAAALERLRAVRDAHVACVNGLGAQRERARRTIEAEFVASSRQVAASLAGYDPDHTLIRVGTVSAPGCGVVLPALLPLLDHGHLWFTGTVSTVDDVVRVVLLRVLSSTSPGSVRLTVYDPERLGGTLSGFAPLGAASLVRFVGPGGLTAMLDDLVEEIQRLNELVLAAGHTSVAALSPRPAPWRGGGAARRRRDVGRVDARHAGAAGSGRAAWAGVWRTRGRSRVAAAGGAHGRPGVDRRRHGSFGGGGGPADQAGRAARS